MKSHMVLFLLFSFIACYIGNEPWHIEAVPVDGFLIASIVMAMVHLYEGLNLYFEEV